jgi:hypothetical protein
LSKPTITAVVSDTHCGGSTALSPPTFETDEGQVIGATKAQGWLWECWGEYWSYVYGLTKRNKARLIVIHVGDVIDGDHHATVQALPNVVDQEDMAYELLEPPANRADRMFVLRGTEAHAGEAAGNEVRIAARLGAEVLWEGMLDIDGTLIDVAHHGRAGKRPWTSGAAGMATEAQITALRMGQPMPRYVLRGHNHIIDDSGEKVYGTRAIALPSWQLRTAYGYRVASGTLSDIGALIILPDGSLDTSRMRYAAAPGQRGITNV